jgi:hypothetical protein
MRFFQLRVVATYQFVMDFDSHAFEPTLDFAGDRAQLFQLIRPVSAGQRAGDSLIVCVDDQRFRPTRRLCSLDERHAGIKAIDQRKVLSFLGACMGA